MGIGIRRVGQKGSRHSNTWRQSFHSALKSAVVDCARSFGIGSISDAYASGGHLIEEAGVTSAPHKCSNGDIRGTGQMNLENGRGALLHRRGVSGRLKFRHH